MIWTVFYGVEKWVFVICHPSEAMNTNPMFHHLRLSPADEFLLYEVSWLFLAILINYINWVLFGVHVYYKWDEPTFFIA